MGTWTVRARVLVVASCVAGWTALLACSGSGDENPASTHVRDVDSGSQTSNPTSVDSSTLVTNALLCQEYGGADGVRTIALTILNSAKADCRISPLFTDVMESDRGPHLVDCFTTFVQGGFGCPGIAYEQGTTKDRGDELCQSVLPGIKLTDADWKAFGDFNTTSSVTLGVMKAQSPAPSIQDLQTMAEIFVGKKESLRNNDTDQPNEFTQCAPNCTTGQIGNTDACIKTIPDGGLRDGGSGDSGSPDTGTGDAGDSGT
jgi:hypothetical protein